MAERLAEVPQVIGQPVQQHAERQGAARHHVDGREHKRGADILLVYKAAVKGGKLSAADDADEVGWFPLDNLPPLAFETTRKVLQKLTSA